MTDTPTVATHPVQTRWSKYVGKARCPQNVTMRAYEVYCQVYKPQEALVTGECRGGFSTGELIAFLYARSFPKEEWSKRLDEAFHGAENLRGRRREPCLTTCGAAMVVKGEYKCLSCGLTTGLTDVEGPTPLEKWLDTELWNFAHGLALDLGFAHTDMRRKERIHNAMKAAILAAGVASPPTPEVKETQVIEDIWRAYNNGSAAEAIAALRMLERRSWEEARGYIASRLAWKYPLLANRAEEIMSWEYPGVSPDLPKEK